MPKNVYMVKRQKVSKYENDCRSELISSMRLDSRKDIQSVKSAFSTLHL